MDYKYYRSHSAIPGTRRWKKEQRRKRFETMWKFMGFILMLAMLYAAVVMLFCFD